MRNIQGNWAGEKSWEIHFCRNEVILIVKTAKKGRDGLQETCWGRRHLKKCTVFPRGLMKEGNEALNCAGVLWLSCNLYNSESKARPIFWESTKLGHSLLLCICPWILNCKFKLLVVEFLGKIIYLNFWQSEDSASVEMIWGCWATNIHLKRREAKTLFWAEKPKGAKKIHSNEEKLKGIWIQPAVTQIQQLRKISPETMVFHHQKLNVKLNVKSNFKN